MTVGWVAAIAESEMVARAIGQRLDRVRLSVPLGADTAILKLGWRSSDGWEPTRPAATGVTTRGYSKPPDSLLPVHCPPEDRIVATAWERGSTMLFRYEFRPLRHYRPGADPREDRYGITAAFGGLDQLGNCFGALARECIAPDCPDLVSLAADAGYLSYMFVPTMDRRDDPPPRWAKPCRLGVPERADAHLQTWDFAPKPSRRSRPTWRPPATPRQRAYIVALRRGTGVDVGAPLPASLTLPEASAMIDRLRSISSGASG